MMTNEAENAKKRVLAMYPAAHFTENHENDCDDYWVFHRPYSGQPHIGWGVTEDDAWGDAASKIPSPQPALPQGEPLAPLQSEHGGLPALDVTEEDRAEAEKIRARNERAGTLSETGVDDWLLTVRFLKCRERQFLAYITASIAQVAALRGALNASTDQTTEAQMEIHCDGGWKSRALAAEAQFAALGESLALRRESADALNDEIGRVGIEFDGSGVLVNVRAAELEAALARLKGSDPEAENDGIRYRYIRFASMVKPEKKEWRLDFPRIAMKDPRATAFNENVNTGIDSAMARDTLWQENNAVRTSAPGEGKGK